MPRQLLIYSFFVIMGRTHNRYNAITITIYRDSSIKSSYTSQLFVQILSKFTESRIDNLCLHSISLRSLKSALPFLQKVCSSLIDSFLITSEKVKTQTILTQVFCFCFSNPSTSKLLQTLRYTTPNPIFVLCLCELLCQTVYSLFFMESS